MKRLLVLFLAGILALIPFIGCPAPKEESIGMAVEFMDHAACAYISQEKGWFEEEGLNLTTYESHVTGMALASALARPASPSIEVAYVCLVPAINVYANGNVPVKIVAGTHRYGYGLVADPAKITTVEDLENPGVRLGCVREGGAVDMLMRRMIDSYDLDEDSILSNVQRMSPPNLVLAIKTGQLDAAFLPEQWATMAEELGFVMLLTSQDIWQDMQGSVLVVKQKLIDSHPDTVRKLVAVSQRATDWINEHPAEAAEIVAGQMQVAIYDTDAAGVAAELEITPQVMQRSMERLEFTTEINPRIIQETIDYVASLGYIQSRFSATEILDLSFLEEQ
jgi:NitT/TauT family transport system substrate-binding protein